jgi:hypothetical protein
MLRTKGYMMKKVWENGKLREDIEMSEEGNDDGVRLVIRDKDVVEDVAISRDAILRAMFKEKPSSQPLTERLIKLVGSHSSPPKRRRRKTSKKAKKRVKATRRRKPRLVCRME